MLYQIVLTAWPPTPPGIFPRTESNPSSVGWAQPKIGKPATWRCEDHILIWCLTSPHTSHLTEVGRPLQESFVLQNVNPLEMVDLHLVLGQVHGVPSRLRLLQCILAHPDLWLRSGQVRERELRICRVSRYWGGAARRPELLFLSGDYKMSSRVHLVNY